MYFQRSSEWILRFRTYDNLSAFLPNIKLEQLQIIVLKRSRDFSKTINICKVNFYCYRPNAFLSNMKLKQLQITVLKRSRDIRKTIDFFERFFSGFRPNIFSKFFWMAHRFYGLWYKLPVCFFFFQILNWSQDRFSFE